MSDKEIINCCREACIKIENYIDGYIYSYDGEFLGVNNRTNNIVYVADLDDNCNYINAKKLENITHEEFQICSSIVKHEGTHTALEDEYIWIAHTANNYSKIVNKNLYQVLMSSYSSVPKNEKIELPITNNLLRDNFARKGLIDVYINNNDPTNGATYWDGTDFIAWGLLSPNGTPQNKFEEYGKIVINNNIYNTFLSSQLEKYKNARVKYSGKYYDIPSSVFNDKANWITGNFTYKTYARNKKNNSFITTKLEATGTKGYSIFWKVIK